MNAGAGSNTIPVRLAVSDATEAVELRTGTDPESNTTSIPAEALLVPVFWRLVTAAIAWSGLIAIAVGGPLRATVVATGDVVVTAPGKRTVKSIEESVFDPELATSARARS